MNRHSGFTLSLVVAAVAAVIFALTLALAGHDGPESADAPQIRHLSATGEPPASSG